MRKAKIQKSWISQTYLINNQQNQDLNLRQKKTKNKKISQYPPGCKAAVDGHFWPRRCEEEMEKLVVFFPFWNDSHSLHSVGRIFGDDYLYLKTCFSCSTDKTFSSWGYKERPALHCTGSARFGGLTAAAEPLKGLRGAPPASSDWRVHSGAYAPWPLSSFPVAVVTKYHKFGGLRQRNFIISQHL